MTASPRARDSRPSLGVRARVPRHAPRRRRGRPARDASPRRRPHRASFASRGGPSNRPRRRRRARRA